MSATGDDVTTAAVSSKVRSLLAVPTPEVLAIKGRWGVGKTYFWNQLIKALATEKALALPKYSYVSLFGLNNLDQLKSAIFEQTVEVGNIVDGVTLKSVKDNIKDFLAIWEEPSRPRGKRVAELGRSLLRRGTTVASQIPFVQSHAGSLLRSGAFLLVRNTLVCIDDLERKGSGLEIRDIMGLVSFLKEQRNCKVALIFNEGSLDEPSSTQYAEYREKVVDVEVEYVPTVKEAVLHVFDEDRLDFTHILGRAELLKLTNIRIIQKIKRILDDLAPFLTELEAETVETVRTTVILLSWAFFSRETGGPSLSYIKGLGETLMWRIEEKKKPSVFELADQKRMPLSESKEKERDEAAQREKWNELLKSYGWLYTEDLDQNIALHIERGFPDKDALERALERKNAEYRDAKGKDAIRNAWRSFHQSFEDDDKQFVKALATAIRDHARYVERDQLNAAVSLIRELGQPQLAESLVDHFVAVNRDRPGIFATDDNFPFPSERPLDPYLTNKFFEERGLTETPMQLADVVHRIAERESWGPTDEEFLSKLSSEDIFKFLKAERSVNLHKYIRVLVQFGEWGNSTERQKAIAETTKSALRQIAAESTLNRLRLQRYKLGPNPSNSTSPSNDAPGERPKG
jgi:hypothetical protein